MIIQPGTAEFQRSGVRTLRPAIRLNRQFSDRREAWDPRCKNRICSKTGIQRRIGMIVRFYHFTGGQAESPVVRFEVALMRKLFM
jgi:hypothetical protein